MYIHYYRNCVHCMHASNMYRSIDSYTCMQYVATCRCMVDSLLIHAHHVPGIGCLHSMQREWMSGSKVNMQYT